MMDDKELAQRYAHAQVDGFEYIYHDLPGALIRRLHQSVAFHLTRELEQRGADLTPVQYSVMAGICTHPGIEQGALADVIQYDRATVGGVVDRLEAKSLVRRSLSPHDRRVRLLTLSVAGKRLLRKLAPGILMAQENILHGLDEAERGQFTALLGKLVRQQQVAMGNAGAEPAAAATPPARRTRREGTAGRTAPARAVKS